MKLHTTLAASAAALSMLAYSATAAPKAYAAVSPTPSMMKVAEGTEVRIRTDDALNSGTSNVGDRFNITLDEPIEVSAGVTIPAGYRGVGEVTVAQKRGHMGKAGQLNIQLTYIKVGDKRIRLRASSAGEGKSSLGNSVALTVLFGPLGLLARGADINIPPGKKITAYVDNDVELPMPLPAPPIAG